MGYIFVVIAVILFFVLLDKNDKIKILTKKVKQLEKEIEELKLQKIEPEEKVFEEKIEKSNFAESPNILVEKQEIKEEIKQENIEQIKNDQIKKIQKENISYKNNDLSSKNSNILTTGAALIVLAAIVFLTSTWGIISNSLKSIILVLVMFVFLGASKLAKDKFKLQKTSETFFNISMAYLPICLISISVFGLLGEYLSIYGEGKFIYFFLAALGLACLYYKIYKNSNNKNLLIGSIISQLTSLTCFASIFESELNLICIVLLLYNFVLIMYTKDELFKVFQKIILYSITIIFSLYIFIADIINSIELLDIISLFLITLNYFMLSKKYKTTALITISNIVLMFSGIFLISYEPLNISAKFSVYLYMLWIIAIFIFSNILSSDKKYLKINTLVSVIMVALIGLDYDNEVFKTYFYFIIEGIFLIVAYKRKVFDEKIGLEFIIPGIYMISGWLLIYDLDLNNISYIIFSDIVLLITLFIKNENWRRGWFIVSHIAIVAAISNWCVNDLDNELFSIYVYLLSIVIYILSYLKYKHISIFKYASYVSVLLTFVMINNYLNLELTYFIIPITVYIITIVETVFKNKLKDYYSEYAIFVFYIISYISLTGGVPIVSLILGIINTITLIILDIYNDEKSIYSYVGGLGLLLLIYVLEDYNLMFLIGGLVFSILSLTKFLNKKEFTILSVLYIILFSVSTQLLIVYGSLFVWAILHTIVYKKQNDIFKTIICISGILLFFEILNILEITEYIWIKLVGIQIFALLFFKTVAKNKWQNNEELEYVFFAIVYLWAMMSYSSVIDGMISVGIMIAIVIFAYSKKYGSTVVLNLVAIIINAFGLTREFWFMIPWWGYLLGIGLALVGFAVKNEAKEQKAIKKNILKTIKESCDKK